jgi:hypothetical protein
MPPFGFAFGNFSAPLPSGWVLGRLALHPTSRRLERDLMKLVDHVSHLLKACFSGSNSSFNFMNFLRGIWRFAVNHLVEGE